MAKIKGEGTRLMRGNGATPEVFTDITQVVSIEGNEISTEDVEQTDLLSTLKEFRPSSVPDPGEVSFQVQFDPDGTDHQVLEDEAMAPVVRTWRIVFNTGATTRPHREFRGYIKSFKPSGFEQDSDVVADVTIKVTGKPTRGTTTITP